MATVQQDVTQQRQSHPKNVKCIDINNPGRARWIGGWWFKPPRPESTDQYSSAEHWQRTFEPDMQKSEAYANARQYAERRYEEVSGLLRDIDRKCEVLLGLGGVVAGIVFAAVRAFEVEFTIPSGIGFFCFLLVILIMAITRSPVKTKTSADIRTVVDSVRFYEDPALLDAKVAGALHCASVATEIVVWWKALQVRRATVVFLIGSTCLFLGLLTSPPIEVKTTTQDYLYSPEVLVQDVDNDKTLFGVWQRSGGSQSRDGARILSALQSTALLSLGDQPDESGRTFRCLFHNHVERGKWHMCHSNFRGQCNPTKSQRTG